MMMVFLLPFRQWYIGWRQGDLEDSWSWAIGFSFFEIVRIKDE